MFSKQSDFTTRTEVPQGAAPGLFLFLIYNNDLADICDKPEIPTFADDTTIIQSRKGRQRLLASDLQPVCDWFSSNKLTNNVANCEAMCFGRGKPVNTKMVSDEEDHRTACKNLGIH